MQSPIDVKQDTIKDVQILYSET